MNTGAHMFTEGHELHRMRRKPLEPFFSRRATEMNEAMIAEMAKLLGRRLEDRKGTRDIVQLEHAYAAYATDVVGEVSFGESLGLMDVENFSPDWSVMIPRTDPES